MKLSGNQEEKLSKALRDAFSPATLRRMLRFKLDKNIDDLAQGNDFEETVFLLIERVNKEEWIDQLLDGALQSNPRNSVLRAFAEQFGLVSTGNAIGSFNGVTGAKALERLITPQNGFIELDRWVQGLGRIEAQVCRVEVQAANGTVYGTGFLVGEDLVLTNYHVVEPVIAKTNGREGKRALVKNSNIILRFDYRKLRDGDTINPGTTYSVLKGDEGLIDSSPPSPFDELAAPGPGELPQSNQLDYAILKLEEKTADDYPGRKSEPGAEKRGYISMSVEAYDFPADTFLFIMHHPQGEPLKLAFDKVIGLNTNQTRVRYRVNTDQGSSGAPCFDKDLRLVALHHVGDPNFFMPAANSFNQGIPTFMIAQLLEKRGLLELLPH